MAMGVSAGIHAALFAAAALMSPSLGESTGTDEVESLRVELVAAAPTGTATAPEVAAVEDLQPHEGETASPELHEGGTSPPAGEPDTTTKDVSATTESAAESPDQEIGVDLAEEAVPEAPLEPDAHAEPPGDNVSPSTTPSVPEHQSAPAYPSYPAARAVDRGLESGSVRSTVQKPRPRNPIIPTYPRRARRLGWEGVTVIRATVETDGSPTALEVVRSSGYELLNRAALDAVQATLFYPGQVGTSQHRRMHVDLRVVFQLSDKESS